MFEIEISETDFGGFLDKAAEMGYQATPEDHLHAIFRTNPSDPLSVAKPTESRPRTPKRF